MILAIAWKDILDGWKNKIILTSVITALFLVIFYNYLPDLTQGDELPLMVIFDPDAYVSVENTIGFTDFNYRVEQQEGIVLETIRDMDTPVIGLKIEQDPFNQETNSSVEFQAYYPYWMTTSQKTNIRTATKTTLERLWGVPIEISEDTVVVYPLMDSYAFGKTFIASVGLLLQLTVMGLSMAPQLIVEEKESRTLQAIVVSPANLSHFVLGKSLAVLFYSIITTTIGLIFIRPLVIHWGLTITALLIGMFTIIMPGILLGVLLESKHQIQIWVWVMFIPTILPIFFSLVRVLPERVMDFVDWWPTVALSRLIRAGFTLNPPINTYRPEAIYLLSISLVFLSITLWTIRRQSIRGA